MSSINICIGKNVFSDANLVIIRLTKQLDEVLRLSPSLGILGTLRLVSVRGGELGIAEGRRGRSSDGFQCGFCMSYTQPNLVTWLS